MQPCYPDEGEPVRQTQTRRSLAVARAMSASGAQEHRTAPGPPAHPRRSTLRRTVGGLAIAALCIFLPLAGHAQSRRLPAKLKLVQSFFIELPRGLAGKLDVDELPGFFVLEDNLLVLQEGYAMYSKGNYSLVANVSEPADYDATGHSLTGEELEIEVHPSKKTYVPLRDVPDGRSPGARMIIEYCSCGDNTHATPGDHCKVWANGVSHPDCRGNCTEENEGTVCRWKWILIQPDGQVGILE